MILSAMNSRTPPSAALGICCNSEAPKASSPTTIATAARPATWDRPPVSDTTAVRGGLALTGNAPSKPESTLPTPTPTKSRSTSGASFGSEGKDRVVAAVCTMMTIEMMRLSGTRLTRFPPETTGIASAGILAETAPRTLTPRPSRPSSTTAALASARPINAPGIRALICSETVMIAKTPRPMTSVNRFVWFSCAASVATRCSMGPAGAGSPSIAGNCEIRMWTEMPARKPIVTGIESRSAIQPRRNIPAAKSKSPTISASAAASITSSGEPAIARAARPPAKIGVMVESAPHDKKRLLPNAAKASEPARKAKKPICGVNPPSRAVAICSGMAIAASVRPANRSRLRN